MEVKNITSSLWSKLRRRRSMRRLRGRSHHRRYHRQIAPPDRTAVTVSGDLSTFRPWSDLPSDLLLPILHRLSLSLPDLVSFAAACRSWRLLSASSAASFSGPPFLLSPSLTLYRRGHRRWSRPACCRLQTLTLTTRSYPSLLPSKTIRKSCLGSAFGHLIFLVGKRAVLSDPLTGEEIQSPILPFSYLSSSFVFGLLREFSVGILTAPLNSSSCLLLLVSSSDHILWWHPRNDGGWSEFKLGNFLEGKLISLVAVKERVFVLDSYCNLIVVKFVPVLSWRRLKVPPPAGSFTIDDLHRDRRLVEREGELLFVSFPETGENQVYRLDMSNSSWVKMEGLGDWCLFVHRKLVLPYPDPMRWAGEKNSVYFIRPGSELHSWSVVPFDGGVVDTIGNYPFSEATAEKLFPWPSPIWVCPIRKDGIR